MLVKCTFIKDFFDQSFVRDSSNEDEEEPTPPTP